MLKINHILCGLVLFTFLYNVAQASDGDRNLFFRNCLINCERRNCSEDGLEIQEQAVAYYRQTIFDKLFLWTCMDECQYGCMWKTVEAFQERNWPIPQFFGKWPFVRFMGIQEPASTFFSIANFISHMWAIKRFRRDVRSDSPFYKLWHLFAIVNLNGWFWSAVFHTRDMNLTELLDYTFANSIILVMFYCMIMRLANLRLMFFKILVSAIFILYFLTYFSTLAVGKITYSFNMKVNIFIGVFTALVWLSWCYVNSKERPYSRQLVKFYFLFMLATTLEIFDFPPFLWVLDSHALWHLSTVALVPLFYKFAADDCRALRAEKYISYKQVKKEI